MKLLLTVLWGVLCLSLVAAEEICVRITWGSSAAEDAAGQPYAAAATVLIRFLGFPERQVPVIHRGECLVCLDEEVLRRCTSISLLDEDGDVLFAEPIDVSKGVSPGRVIRLDADSPIYGMKRAKP